MKVSLIIPCFNEANRLKISEINNLVSEEKIEHLIFVDDGSTDDTWQLLNQIKKDFGDKIHLIHNKTNDGKSRAVQLGILYAFTNTTSSHLGFLDADFFIPYQEVLRILSLFKSDTLFLFGSKYRNKQLMKKRKFYRQFFGKFFSSLVSKLIGLKIYDSQCGVKFFDRSIITTLFEQPLITNWTFDVELFIRFKKAKYPDSKIQEIPLESFNEITESKLKLLDFLTAPFELLKIYFHYNINQP